MSALTPEVQVTATFASKYVPGQIVNDTGRLANQARKKAQKEARRAARCVLTGGTPRCWGPRP